MEKKEYTAPKMTVIEMNLEAPLLGGSNLDEPSGISEYDDEFGYNFGHDMDNKG